MAKGDTLVLKVDSYDQLQPDDDPKSGVRSVKSYSRGDSFEALSDAEYDRLIEIEAAVDPEQENERQRQEAQARIDALNAERDRLQAEIDAAETEGDLSSATKPELVDYLAANDLDTEGTKAELLERAQAHQASQE